MIVDNIIPSYPYMLCKGVVPSSEKCFLMNVDDLRSLTRVRVFRAIPSSPRNYSRNVAPSKNRREGGALMLAGIFNYILVMACSKKWDSLPRKLSNTSGM